MSSFGPQRPRSPLAKIQAPTINADATKVHGWNNHGILVVSADDHRLSCVEQELVKQLGEKLYGRSRRQEVCHA